MTNLKDIEENPNNYVTLSTVLELLKFIHELEQEAILIENWKKRGEEIIETPGKVSLAFKLGGWWADRPWRRI